MRKFPVFLLVDVSESMAGEALTQLETGMRSITSDLMQDPYALESVWISVIAFAGRARTLVPLTELTEFVPPHLPVGGGTGFGVALMHLMNEIDANVTPSTSQQKGDWKPLVFLMTDGVSTDDAGAALDRWKASYANRVSLVAVSIGGGGDEALLSQLTDEIIRFDDTVQGSFIKFITWITNSVKSSTRSVTAGAGISLTKLDDAIADTKAGGLPYADVDDRYAVFTGRCAQNKAPYIVKYERHMGNIGAHDAQLASMFQTRDYVLKAAMPVQQDYFELSDGAGATSHVNSDQLIGQPNCPQCFAPYGMAMCRCGGVHCVTGDGQATCPWCGKIGNYGAANDGSGGFEIGRGKG